MVQDTNNNFVGIDLGGTNIKIGVLNDVGETLAYLSTPTYVERGPEDATKRMAQAVLEAIEKEKAPPEATPDPKPPQPDSPPEEPKAIEVECDLVFDRKGDEFEVRVVAEKKELGRFTCPADPRKFDREIRDFTEGAAGALAKLLRERTRQGTVQLTVNLVVRNGLIYWAAVSGVSESVRAAVEGFGEAVSAEISEARGR